jgi:hypothetical protein
MQCSVSREITWGGYLPAEKLERPMIQGSVVDARQTMCDSVLHRQIESLLELLVRRLRTMRIG